MAFATKGKAWLAGLALVGLLAPAAAAPNTPTVQQMLAFKPIQKGVVISTPAAAEYDKCKVELVEGTAKGSSGWVLKDPQGRLLRRFFDSNGDKYPDQWCYYKDGMEVYREVDSNFNGKADRYLWLNGGGSKIGLDRNEDGVIDTWLALSAEELSQEVVKAFAGKDLKTLERLLVTEADLAQLGAPAKEIARIKELQKGVPAKFQQTLAKLTHLNDATHWLHLEAGAPSRLPVEATGMKQDVLMHYRGLILCETAGKHDWIQVGEMVLVGEAWKLLDAPLPGDAEPAPTTKDQAVAAAPATDKVADELVTKIAKLDEAAPAVKGGPQAEVVAYHGQRAELIEQMIAHVTKDEDKALWTKQLADSLAAAVQASDPKDGRAADRLAKLVALVTKQAPGSEVAAYVAYRELSTQYSRKVEEAKKPEEMLAAQTWYQEKLVQFVAGNPKAEEAADALLQLGTLGEYQNKEADAKKWYEQLAQNFPASRQAVRANGALKRLALEGKVFELTGPAVSLGGPAYNPAALRGKVVVVYYWASWCQSVAADFAKLKKLAADYYGKGLEVVCVNVDDNQPDAEAVVKRAQPPGCQLFSAGGLDSPLATQYGLIVFPNVFLVGRDGKVLSRTVEVNGLEEELKKVMK